uniref:Uncharacterized protein n=2 Tax=Timema TaxID=61471 RepID=A0A7R9GS82_TIMPO|nr:unnamed protein product [Timema douglasi]CAD7395422.1 unnamed protein product [Timema poppensis]
MPSHRNSKHHLVLQATFVTLMMVLVSGTSSDTSPQGPSPRDETVSTIDLSHVDEAAGSDSDLEFRKRLYDFGLGKRAYSYVSEYKRLPVYNFGLGKRNKMYNFGLGKRGDARQYSFGLGKRPADYDEYYSEENEEDTSDGDDSLNDVDYDNDMDKRNRQYSFGLGKRSRPYSFGLGKRVPSGSQSLYGFGLGKRGGQSPYSFGLGKRANGRLYAFGLGKRPVNSEGRQTYSRFNFGLGKRSEEDSGPVDDDMVDEGKRSPQHRFSFGLGKREVAQSELDAVRQENKETFLGNHQHDNTEHRNSPDDKNVVAHVINKRSISYPFAVGKLGLGVGSEDGEENDIDDFSRFARRPYSFGLGKRIPMYDFGIGKRSSLN